MAKAVTPAKAILLAAHFAGAGQIQRLRTTVFAHRRILRNELVLRLLLSFLPETLEPAEYVSFLQEIANEDAATIEEAVDTTWVDSMSDEDASHHLSQLKLSPLLWSNSPVDVPDDVFTQFLLHRAYNIDRNTGLSAALPDLIVPFISRSEYLRTWMISSLLPLHRLNYEYHPQQSAHRTIDDFERMSDRGGVNYLLEHTVGLGGVVKGPVASEVARDLRGLVGPWMYGDIRSKRRRLRQASTAEAQALEPLSDELNMPDDVGSAWESAFDWIAAQAGGSWTTCVEAIEHWEGPGDIDLGGFGGAYAGLGDKVQQRLERRYARVAIAAAYSISEASLEALSGARRICTRIESLLDLPPSLSLYDAATRLLPVDDSVSHLLNEANAKFLRTETFSETNPLTAPAAPVIHLLHGIILSAFLLTRIGIPYTICRVGQLLLVEDEKAQSELFHALLRKVSDTHAGDDQLWVRARKEILWLHNWGVDESTSRTCGQMGRGPLGRVAREALEIGLLKTMLEHSRFTLCQSIYETNEKPLTEAVLRHTVVSAALEAYDNASNASRTRGGVKKCHDIMAAFPAVMKGTQVKTRIESLIKVTDSIGKYRLVVKQGQPFTPIDLRMHSDPLALLERILANNPGSYTKINDFVDMANAMVLSGLIKEDNTGQRDVDGGNQQERKEYAKRRVQAMCIDAALTEDDFETAYSYAMTRLSLPVTSLKKSSDPISNIGDTIHDDYSWRAALQAGEYRTTPRTTLPSHLGNDPSNLEIRHLTHRLDCISLALRIAPLPALQGILNIFRRCEEELEVKIREDAEAEHAWDDAGDSTMSVPGGFGADPAPTSLSRHGASGTALSARHRHADDNGPVSIFDLTRASAAQAQKTLSALSGLKLGAARSQALSAGSQEANMANVHVARDIAAKGRSSTEMVRDEEARVRKRDQLREAAVSGLASGVGWLIGAPAAPRPGSRGSER